MEMTLELLTISCSEVKMMGVEGGCIFHSFLNEGSWNPLPISKRVFIDSTMSVATKLIKGGKEHAISQVRNSIIPGLIIWRLPIKNIRIPFSVRSPCDFRECFPFFISVGANLDVGKPMSKRKEVDIAIRSRD